MRRLLAVTLLLLIPITVVAEEETAPEPWVTETNDARIPMRDGKELAAKVLLPEERGEYPCILVQTPYNKDRMGQESGDTGSGEIARGSSKAWSQFDRENYAYVFVDWRGFYGSKSAMQGVNKRKWKRGQDGYDCVEWIAEQSWCNGKVGTWGGSALGKQQFDTAAEQPPHLVCAAPLIAYQGSRYSAYYEGGVLLDYHVKGLDRLGFGVGKLVKENPLPSRLWTFVESQGYAPKKIKVPCLMIAGWWDNYPREVVQQWEDLAKQTGKAGESKLIMGPWSHTAIDLAEQGDMKFENAANWSTEVTLKFFDHYLRSIEDSGWEKVAKVNAFQCNEGKWVGGDSWDKLCGKQTTWFLQADGAVSEAKPGEATDEKPLTREYTYDPKDPSPTIGGQNLPPATHGPKDVSRIEKRDDVLIYETELLKEPLAIRGEVALTVQFKCNRVDTDIHVRLCDDDGEGLSYLVAETIQRAKLRDGEKVQLLKPGETYSLTLRLPPHAYTWQKGHKLKLIVTGGNAPRYEPNTHNGDDHFSLAKAQDVDVTIFHDVERAAVLLLPIVK